MLFASKKTHTSLSLAMAGSYTAAHDGSVTVSCTFRSLSSGCQILAALYSGDGQLLDLRCVAAGEDFAQQNATLTAKTKDGLCLRAFAWDAGKGFAPLCDKLIDETLA